MSEISPRSNKVARRFGGVLFAFAHQHKALKDVMGDLTLFRAAIEAEPAEWLRIASPSLPLYTQRKIMERLIASLKLGKIMNHFLMILCGNRRLPDMKAILDEFLEQVKHAEGIMDGILETPLKVSDKELKEVQQTLTTHLGTKIHLHQKVNEKLIGGVVLHLGSLMIDGSTRTRLNKLKTAMKG